MLLLLTRIPVAQEQYSRGMGLFSSFRSAVLAFLCVKVSEAADIYDTAHSARCMTQRPNQVPLSESFSELSQL